jgi:hypothetical protein
VQPFGSTASWTDNLPVGSYNVAVYARSNGSTATWEAIANMVYVVD